MVPKIPKDHKDMDPEKVKLFTEFGAAERSTSIISKNFQHSFHIHASKSIQT